MNRQNESQPVQRNADINESWGCKKKTNIDLNHYCVSFNTFYKIWTKYVRENPYSGKGSYIAGFFGGGGLLLGKLLYNTGFEDNKPVLYCVVYFQVYHMLHSPPLSCLHDHGFPRHPYLLVSEIRTMHIFIIVSPVLINMFVKAEDSKYLMQGLSQSIIFFIVCLVWQFCT